MNGVVLASEGGGVGDVGNELFRNDRNDHVSIMFRLAFLKLSQSSNMRSLRFEIPECSETKKNAIRQLQRSKMKVASTSDT